MLIFVLPFILCAAMMVCCVCFLLCLRNGRPKGDVPLPLSTTGDGSSAGFKPTGITFFGQSKADDNGVGFVGVDLFKHGTAGLQFNGKPLFPAAVFQGDAAGLLWSVLEVRSDSFTKNKSVYVHIVDVCNSSQDVCKTNKSKHGFLVDIHNTAYEYVGVNDGVLKGEYRLAGHLKPGSILSNIWLKSDDYIACSCTGSCKGSDVKWTKRSNCT